MSEFDKSEHDSKEPIDPFQKRPWPPILPYMLATAAVLSGVLAGVALPALIGAETFVDYLKSTLIAVLATMIAYGVNRLAIDRGAYLAARGMIAAFILSVVSVLTMGTGFWMATYPGLVAQPTEILRYQDFAKDQHFYIDRTVSAAEQSAQVFPLLSGIVTDLTTKKKCEFDEGCISQKGGGTGVTHDTIDSKLQQAASMAETVASLDRERAGAAAQLAGLQAEFQAMIVNEGLSLRERRIELQNLQAAIARQLARLRESVPTAVIAAYAEDLEQGALINGNANASTNLTLVLEGYGRALRRVLQNADAEVGEAPTFPAQTGVADTLGYVWHFFPVAIIVGVVELIFPITLWLYTYFGYLARVRREEA